MSERLAALLVSLATLIASPAAGEPAARVDLLDLPFKVREIRNADSEVALAIATSGVIRLAKPATVGTSVDRTATQVDEIVPIVVVWGEDGGAVLSLSDGKVTTTLLGAEAITGFSATETAPTATPGSRRSVSGALTAYFTGTLGAPGRAPGLTIRERQPVAMASEPKVVPFATGTVSPADGSAFVASKPQVTTLDGRPIVLAVMRWDSGSSALALVSKRDEIWRIVAQSERRSEVADAPLCIAAIADFQGNGRKQIAVIQPRGNAGSVELWTFVEGALARGSEATISVALPEAGRSVLAAAVPSDRSGAADLAVATGDRSALAVLSFENGVRERASIVMPAPVASGIAVLGRGRDARILVGLADGRIASVAEDGTRP